MKTVRLTVAQALVKFLDNQYVEFDGKEIKFILNLGKFEQTQVKLWVLRRIGL